MNETTYENELMTSLKMELRLNKLTLLVASLKNIPYVCWLKALREVEIMITLCNNFDKIPPRTPSKLIAGFFMKSPKAKKWLYKLEKRLRARIY